MERRNTSAGNKLDGSGNRSSGDRHGSTGGERVSVHSFEEQARKSDGHVDYSTARSRKHRRRIERGNGKALWFSVAGVVFVYLTLLAAHLLTSDNIIVQPVVALAAEKTVDSSNQESSEGDSRGFSLPSSEPVDAIVSVSNLIEDINRAQELTREGKKLYRTRRFAASQAKLQEAILLAPNMQETLVELSKVLQEQNNDTQARDVLLRAISIDPESVATRLMLAQTFFGLRENENALAMALWVLESQPYSEAAHQIAADVYTAMDRNGAAIYHWQKIAALNSGNHAAKNSLGAALLNEGQIAQAISVFEGVIRDDPGNSQAHYYLAICFIRKNEPELAVGVLANAATRLGIQFVKAWAKSPEFDPLRELPSFQRQFSDQGIVPGGPLDTTGL